jgi:AAA family ATP:ADP antiporter
MGAYIGAFYGDYFLYVTIGAFLLQAFVVSRIVKYLGLRGVVLALPLVALGTYTLFAVGVGVLGIFVLRWAKSAENMTDYSIMNNGKAMVWLPTSRGAKYKAKQAIDTLAVRIGDVISATMFIVGSAALGMGMRSFALINLALVAVWLFATFLLLRHNKQIEENPASDPVATGVSQ